MKKKRKELKQLNKTSIIKLLIFVFIIVLIEAAAGFFTFYQFSSRTYKQDYETYQRVADKLAETIAANNADDWTHVSDSDSAKNNINEALTAYSANEYDYDFNYWVIFREPDGGVVVYSGLPETISNLKADYSLDYMDVSQIKISGNTYLFASSKVEDSDYRIGIFRDFNERKGIISNLYGNIVVALVVAGATVITCFVIYAFLAGNRQKLPGFKYNLAIDSKTGKVLHSNAAFKKEFTAISEIKAPETLNQKGLNLLSLNANYGEKLIALRANQSGSVTKIFADDVSNQESFIQTSGNDELGSDGKTTGALSKVYESFVAKGKRTLLGVMFISNLDQIKTLFGKQMALDIQKLILKKAREKFTYAYEIDFAFIGITFPDGKKLDNLMTDLPDILRYVTAPITMDDNLFTLGIRSGFAMCDSNMKDLSFDYAYKAAEAARQRAIDTGIAEYLIYNESQRKLYDKYFITFDIKQMLAEGAFEMEYQPQYHIKDERIEGFEALFRVKKSWNVNVDTFSFITYAERTGAMVQLGDFIFDTGMQFAKRLEDKNISVSLNVSPVQLMQAGFTENFLKLYRKYGLKAGSICVEITESFLMTNFTETLKKLAVLNSNGIDVHLDDFGTEYSSLLYIKKLPITTIKIDKEFVKDVLVSKESQAIIRFITNIAKLLNRTTICEGVETPQEFDMLNYLGCDTIQGWVIGKSMKPDAALEFAETFDYKKVVEAFNGGKK